MKTILETTVRDWRIGEGVELDVPEDAKEYKLKIAYNNTTGQVDIEVNDGNDQGLTLIIEINNGKPCLHVGIDSCGDNLLHIASVDGALLVTPESNVEQKVAAASRYTYDAKDSIEFS